ncbi:MAG: DNA-processing protein DprA [Microbacterium sp.]|uniref:DNA-processing protein DprA n=1 Tax=unclassified Microbacterium TaxID=2609290 RepID=UPI000EDEA384|nr:MULTISPECIES: DNA-processing protein DprA [unclassified Microbacterium]HCU77941.1 DNA-processing protein DprA [Microbacterium sp.]|tara:strand:- start:5250 stop:6218 length:969 start_codon:yes stop_codon:yes gene_type:complete
MPDTPDDARLTLAIASEPGDRITGTLLAAVGATETLRLITSDTPLPGVVDPVEGGIWRGRLAPRLPAAGGVDRVREHTDRLGLCLLTPGAAGWPEGLSDLGVLAPLALWAKGDIGVLTSSLGSRVTIVGARAATGYGEHVATEFATDLAGLPRVVVSGGAYGIDGAAHGAALTTRPGSTIAVLAGGLDRNYPAGHQELLSRVAESGAVLSELSPGAAPTRWRFLQRGRLLAAISAATIVVEAGYRSGSLHTAAEAHALGRPVGAVPGPITSAASAGCHRLLHEKIATVISSASDIAALTDPPAPPDAPARTAPAASPLAWTL